MLSIQQPQLETFAALLLAHLLADFIFQTKEMVERKKEPKVLFLHIVVVYAATIATLGGSWLIALGIASTHLVIDAIKTWLTRKSNEQNTVLFLVDQAAHILTILIAALLWPNAASSGLWQPWLETALIPMLILSGFIASTNAGGHIVALATKPYSEGFEGKGLPNAGKVIGQLERTLIYLLIAVGQPAGIGFLIAAKSFLRFEATKQQEASEYVIIGTLSSFLWAILVGNITFYVVEIAASY